MTSSASWPTATGAGAEAVSRAVPGWLRALCGALVALLVVAGTTWRAAPAWAVDDSIDSWSLDYTIRPDGTAEVREQIAYRFGTNSGRHGIRRDLVTREAWDDAHDAVYPVSRVTVSSQEADPTVVAQEVAKGRDAVLWLRIGSASRTIHEPVAHYVIHYVVDGTTRSAGGVDQFHWDVLGAATPAARDITVTVRAPGGVQRTACYTGIPGRSITTPCTSATVRQGIATYTLESKPAGEALTVTAALADGAVRPVGPILEERADAAEHRITHWALVSTLASLVCSPLLGLLWWRRRGRDLRYVGLAPGIVPGPGEKVAVRPSGDVEVPVAFSPPTISPAEAQVLLDGTVSTDMTTATLVDLAVRGAVQLSAAGRSASVRLVDASKATRPHEHVLLQRLFADQGEVDASLRGSLHRAHRSLVVSVTNQVAAAKWFTLQPSAVGQGVGCSAVLLLPLAVALVSAGGVLLLLAPLVPVALTGLVLRRKAARGRRSALGRALTDQVEGFRLYLATAEADQIRVEEGQDVFSRYLPWAIVFGLADRWADLCAQLVREGRLSAEPPTWYYGPWDGWNLYVLTSSLSTMGEAAAPVPAPEVSTSGSGFGGGSGFDSSGGFSGGGGGGGGVRSW